jgi:cold shock CspA family protein
MNRGTIWRWNPRTGTGVIALVDTIPELAWFHFSAFDDASFPEVSVGLPVEVDVDHTPQEDFACRAWRIRLALPSSWQC